MKSDKPIKTFEECFKKYEAIFPLSAANERDPITHKPTIYISINQNTRYVPVDVPVTLEYPEWELLRSIAFQGLQMYDYDPIRKNGWYPF